MKIGSRWHTTDICFVLFLISFISTYECSQPICLCSIWMQCTWRPERTSEPWGLEWQMVKATMWVLEDEPRCSFQTQDWDFKYISEKASLRWCTKRDGHEEWEWEARVVAQWSDGQSIDCSPRGPRFNSQHQYGESQYCLTPISGGPIPSSVLCGHWVYMVHTCKQAKHYIHENDKR